MEDMTVTDLPMLPNLFAHAGAMMGLAAAAIAGLFLFVTNRRLRQCRCRLVAANRELRDHLRQAQARQEALQEQVLRDPLTGLLNRRYLDEAMAIEVQRAARTHEPLSLVMLDVDYFKRINDDHGHQAGDLALRSLARLLDANVRTGDIVCRYGGEEFVILLPDATTETAMERAECWRRLVEDSALTFNGRQIRLTASFGVATYADHAASADALVRAADAALYDAKNGGRNRVAVAGQPADRALLRLVS
jgi:diguanylate cyclase (GGDEF)-like protein